MNILLALAIALAAAPPSAAEEARLKAELKAAAEPWLNCFMETAVANGKKIKNDDRLADYAFAKCATLENQIGVRGANFAQAHGGPLPPQKLVEMKAKWRAEAKVAMVKVVRMTRMFGITDIKD
ncbi:MAG TPA: hypothetical protein VGR19_07345 [Allosphingosinicella sp.]|nr:hypothetical protein [Allosphingosinicella sp.]